MWLSGGKGQHHFQTGQGLHQANQQQRGFAASDACRCRERQTIIDIIDFCPDFNLEGGLQRLHEADEFAVRQLDTVAKSALAK